MFLGEFLQPHCFVLPYVHTYIPLCMCFMLLFLYIHKCYLYYPISIHNISVCWLLYIFQRIVPTTNTHITNEQIIYVLLKQLLAHLTHWKWFLYTLAGLPICFLPQPSSCAGVILYIPVQAQHWYYSDTGYLRSIWSNLTPFVPLLFHPMWSLGHTLTILSSRMGIFIIEEHYVADVSAMMSSELRRHFTPINF